jgi:hypothetical protein
MSFQYGLRAARNLADIADNNACVDNLGIVREDLRLIQGVAAAGVTSSDYAALSGLNQNLVASVASLTSSSVTVSGIVVQKASNRGDTFSGNVSVSGINNDRPYYGSGNAIYGPSTTSFFTPLSGTTYSGGSSYRLGPVNPSIAATSGVVYEGSLQSWNQYFVPYKRCFVAREQPSWTSRNIPLHLPSPLSIASNKLWFDAEFSNFTLAGGAISEWKDVANRATAVQSASLERPTIGSGIANGKNGVVFDGNDRLLLGDLSPLFPSAATLVVGVFLGTVGTASGVDQYTIFSTLNSAFTRWKYATADGVNPATFGNFGVFTQSMVEVFPPSGMPTLGNYVFTVKVSNQHGISLRQNGQFVAQRSGITYAPVTSGDYYFGGPMSSYIIGGTQNASDSLRGAIYSLALFDEILDDKTTSTVEEYISWRYGIPSVFD